MKKLTKLSLIFAGLFSIISTNETLAVLKYEPVKVVDDLMTDHGYPSPARVDAAFEARRTPENGKQVDTLKQIYRDFVARKGISVEEVDPKPQFVESALGFGNGAQFIRYLDELGKARVSVDMHRAEQLHEFLTQIGYGRNESVNTMIERGETTKKISYELFEGILAYQGGGDALEAKISLLEFLKSPEVQELINTPGKLDAELARSKENRF